MSETTGMLSTNPETAENITCIRCGLSIQSDVLKFHQTSNCKGSRPGERYSLTTTEE